MLQKLKPGGVVVWVVGDKTTKGCEELVPFTQALRFKELGFNVWDTMVFHREIPYTALVRYNQNFEFIFVLSKGKVKTFNPIKIPKTFDNKPSQAETKTFRKPDGSTYKLGEEGQERLRKACENPMKTHGAIWHYTVGYMHSSKDKESFEHPATFPEQLAMDSILSWTNSGDLVVDVFSGSGTTAKMSMLNGRNYIGFEISQEYCDLSESRLAKYKLQQKLDLQE